jgi:hypothetical protein
MGPFAGKAKKVGQRVVDSPRGSEYTTRLDAPDRPGLPPVPELPKGV